MNHGRLAVCAALLACLPTGCATVPLTYAEWKKLQADRAKFARDGAHYMTPEELREEVAKMKREAQDTTFAPKSN